MQTRARKRAKSAKQQPFLRLPSPLWGTIVSMLDFNSMASFDASATSKSMRPAFLCCLSMMPVLQLKLRGDKGKTYTHCVDLEDYEDEEKPNPEDVEGFCFYAPNGLPVFDLEPGLLFTFDASEKDEDEKIIKSSLSPRYEEDHNAGLLRWLFVRGIALSGLDIDEAVAGTLRPSVFKEMQKQLSLTSLRLENTANSTLMAIFPECPNLRRVNLNFCHQVGDDALRCLMQHCAHIEDLDLRCCLAVTGEVVASLAQTYAAQLAEIDLGGDEIVIFGMNCGAGPKVTDATIDSLSAHCPNLKRVSLMEQNDISVEAVSDLVNAAHLQHLIVPNSPH